MHSVLEDIEEISEELFFVAGSPAMRKLRMQAELLAKVNVPVLIVGESGSGKEVTARLIHKLSIRSECRFLKVDCAALPPDLLESELFGYEREGFTGAMGTRHGKFELCHNGTILLDEIAEMPTAVQAKLLQVLQDKRFFRLGDRASIAMDVRILASTNAGVEAALSDRRLCKDLYYALSAFTICVPPLRDRKEEIPLLLEQFVDHLARQNGLQPRPLSSVLLNACRSYSWPGNLRELENVAKRYLVMGDEFLEFGELGIRSSNDHQEVESSDRMATQRWSDEHGDTAPLKNLLRNIKGETERNAIASMLEKTQWNRKAAARELGISYRGLLYKIREYQLISPLTCSHVSPNKLCAEVPETNREQEECA